MNHEPQWKRAQETESVRIENAVNIPLYTARDRNGLILLVGKKAMLLDLEQKRWMSAPITAIREIEQEADVKKEYIKFITERLNLEPFSRKERPKQFWQSLFSRNRSPGLNARNYQRYLPYLQLKSSELLVCGSVRWLIDRYNGIILAYDKNDICVYRDMIGDRILAADVYEEKLYLLPERTEKIIEIKLL